MSNDGKILKNSVGVALATFCSRVAGLFRVRLEAFTLGGGTFASIWALTLMIPNLLRRLLGEGAMGSALTPLIAETEKESGITTARLHLAQILSVLGVLLALIVAIASLIASCLGKSSAFFGSEFLASERFTGVCELLPLILPYTFFICLTGVIGAVLNYSGIFVRPALTALFFNLCMIGGLISGWVLDFSPDDLLTLLAVLTPVAGAVQFLLMLWMLKCCGRFPLFSKEAFRNFAITGRLFKIAAPGIIGYSALQLSFLVDRMLALYIGDQAVPALTYVDRIIDLPIGLFAVSLGSVLMASMTHAAADHDWKELTNQLNFSLRHVWFIGSAMASGIIFCHVEILRVLCLGGKYTMSDLNAARMVAVFYGMGIPFFCMVKVLLPAFYSRKDMKRPFFISLIAISVNLIFNLILMFPLQQGGLALATVISSAVNNSCLLFLLHRDGFKVTKQTILSCVRSVSISLLAGTAVYFLMPLLKNEFTPGFVTDCILLVICGITFLFVFLILCIVFRAGELVEFAAILRRKKKKSA